MMEKPGSMAFSQGNLQPGSEAKDQEKVLESEPRSSAVNSSPDGFNYLHGWRHLAIATGLTFGLFLVNFELVITSTALVSITNDLKSFDQSSWIATGYLCTYIAGLAIWAKFSDHFGRKGTIVAAFVIFAVFSGGCGAAQTTVQLIICRVFQGVGASGQYATGITAIYELVPPNKYPLYTTLVIVAVATAFAVGPIFGGLIVRSGDWRWIFLLNVPASVLAGALVFVGMPSDFPHQGVPAELKPARPSLRTFDLVGATFMVTALVLVMAGLNEAATSLEWVPGGVLGPIMGAVLALVVFLGWEWHATKPTSGVHPLFPWRFVQSRPIVGMLVTCVCTGAVNVGCIFQIPQRYQTAAGLTPLDAGIRLIAFSVCGAFGSAIGATLCKKERMPVIYIALGGSLMQIIGLVFLSRGDEHDPDWRGFLGLQAVIGLGYGAVIGMQTLLTPPLAEKRDLAAATGATVQFRFLGSAIAIAVMNAVAGKYVKTRVEGLMTPDQIRAMFMSVDTIFELPESVQTVVRHIWVLAFNVEMRILLGLAVVSFLASAAMWQRPNVRVP